jgi:hypothetical protein
MVAGTFLLRILGLALLLALATYVLWWGIRTCRALWRRGTSRWGVLVYNYGVRLFGGMAAIGITFIGGYVGATVAAVSDADVTRCMIAGAFLAAIFGIPVALGMGYWWGCEMARFYGLEPDADRPDAKNGARL